MYRSDFNNDVNWRLINDRDLSHAQINAILRTVAARRSEVPATATYRSGFVVDVEVDEAEAQQPASATPGAKKAPAPKVDRAEAAKAFIAANPGASTRAVAAHLGLAHQQVTAVLTSLVRRGLAIKANKGGHAVYTLVG